MPDVQPPLTARGRAWRFIACVAISAAAWGEIAGVQAARYPGWFWLDLAAGVVAFGLVQLRRRRPVVVAVVLTLFGLFSMSAMGPAVLALASLATRRRLTEIVPVAVLDVTVLLVYGVFVTSEDTWVARYSPVEGPPWALLAFGAAVTLSVVVLGMYVGSRRELEANLRDQAARAKAEQEQRAEQARAAERARIAREMHDALAHRISLVSIHAGALTYRDDLTPDQLHETAQVIKAKAHEALDDLRQVLAVLQDDEDGVPRRRPALTDLDTLLVEASEVGTDVTLTREVTGSPADQAGRTVYRIVQEGLTNARKHAPGRPVSVSVTGSPDTGLDVRVCNPRGRLDRSLVPGAGRGLVGLQEKVEMAGGTFEVVETADSFTLRSWLPWAT